MHITQKTFGRFGGETITQYSLTNDNDMTLRFLTFGARVQQMRLPNRHGANPNLLLGFVTLEDYLHQPGLFGAAIGPIFGKNAAGELHSGRTGWQNWNWAAETVKNKETISITFSLDLPTGADGIAGKQHVAITHTLDNANNWHIDWQIDTDQPVGLRPSLNLPFALTGDPAKTISNEKLTLAGEPIPLAQTKALITTATKATLSAEDWRLTWQTDAAGLALSTLPNIGETNNFSGILGHPHVALTLRPLIDTGDVPYVLPAGEAYKRSTTISLEQSGGEGA